ncbi:hypothetical protein ACWCSD_03660 [Nonomuraea sp. NPDC001684]
MLDHVDSPQELVHAADKAMFLLLYGCAEKLLRRALAADPHAADGRASQVLSELLARQGRIKALRALADSGDIVAADSLMLLLVNRGRADEAMALCLRAGRARLAHPWVVANLLVEQGREEDALSFWRALADNGDPEAANSLAALLADLGRLDDLRALADDGNDLAAHRLTELLVEQGRIEALRALADDGFPYAADQLASLLVKRGAPDQAIAALRAIPAVGRHPIVATRLGELLLEQGEVDQAIAALRGLAHTGDPSVVRRLLELRVKHAPLRELKALAETGRGMIGELINLLARCGRVDDLRVLAEKGHPHAAQRLAEWLAEQGRTEEAIALLTPVATEDRPNAVAWLARLLAEQGRIGELCDLVESGHFTAGYQLAELGRINELRDLAARGNHVAAALPTDLFGREGRIDELRELAEQGYYPAARCLTELLAEQGRIAEVRELGMAGHADAILWLAKAGRTEDLYLLAGAGEDGAIGPLAALLAGQGRTQELRTLIEAGHYEAAQELAALLAEQEQADELRALVDIGAPSAATRLLNLLIRQGREDQADMIDRFGLPLPDDA